MGQRGENVILCKEETAFDDTEAIQASVGNFISFSVHTN